MQNLMQNLIRGNRYNFSENVVEDTLRIGTTNVQM